MLKDLTWECISREQVGEVAKKIVEGVNSILDYVSVVADMHPIASVLVGMEKQRHENNARIVVVHAAMVDSVYHIGFLTRVHESRIEDELRDKLEALFDKMATTITQFDKVIFSAVHKQRLEHFSSTFHRQKEQLTEMGHIMVQMQLSTLSDSIGELLSQLRMPDTDMEEAEVFVLQHGGPDAVRKNPALVDRVAEILHEKATMGMKEILSQGFEGLLEVQSTRFLKKLESVQDALVTSVSAAQAAVLAGLHEGPHKMIEDGELQAVWERTAFTGLQEHYQGQFHAHPSSAAHKDAWTLQFFSRVIYNSAIADVVDHDGSGYISASELNNFICERQSGRPEWTNAQWFAFWACGWYNNNVWYHQTIRRIIHEVEKSTRSASISHGNQESWQSIQAVISSLTPLMLVSDVEDMAMTRQIPHELRHLQEDYRTYEESRVASNLDDFGKHLTDRASLQYVVGGSRIELRVMPLLYVLVLHLRDTIKKIIDSEHIENADFIAVEELATSCIAVFVAFNDRMGDLIRGWRSEGKDIDKQVDRYIDGMFKRCYREPHVYEQAYDNLRGSVFGSDITLPRHLRLFGSSHKREQSVRMTGSTRYAHLHRVDYSNVHPDRYSGPRSGCAFRTGEHLGTPTDRAREATSCKCGPSKCTALGGYECGFGAVSIQPVPGEDWRSRWFSAASKTSDGHLLERRAVPTRFFGRGMR
ncbi:hypothetical protein BV20DRAFT_1002805 [Pilatotrama ljubarskyi]|nr:hypothetical protein BV20DRAFT_1002805 [Pilatotrama ljubarskyi]